MAGSGGRWGRMTGCSPPTAGLHLTAFAFMSSIALLIMAGLICATSSEMLAWSWLRVACLQGEGCWPLPCEGPRGSSLAGRGQAIEEATPCSASTSCCLLIDLDSDDITSFSFRVKIKWKCQTLDVDGYRHDLSKLLLDFSPTIELYLPWLFSTKQGFFRHSVLYLIFVCDLILLIYSFQQSISLSFSFS